MTSQVIPLEHAGAASACLESGNVVCQRHGILYRSRRRTGRSFRLRCWQSGKNVSFDPATGQVGGSVARRARLSAALRGMLSRFSDEAQAFVAARVSGVRAAPRARPHELPAGRNRRARLVVAQGRHAAARRRVSRDAGAGPPDSSRVRQRQPARTAAIVAGRRQLRRGRRALRAEAVACRCRARRACCSALRLTKTRAVAVRRADAAAARSHEGGHGVPAEPRRRRRVDFPAGSAWMAFTDQVSHAAMAGQYQLEQTFLLPVGAMLDEQRSPLRILERLKGRRLA